MEPVPAPALPLRRQRLLCGAGLGAGIVAAYVLAALTPELIVHHDLLLESLTASASSLVTGGAYARVGRTALVLVLLAPLLGVLLYDVFYWWAGRLWGDAIVSRYTSGAPRRLRWLRRAEGIVRRRGVWALVLGYYLPVPNPVIQACCGISGMPLAVFLIGDAIGTLLWEGLLVGLGWSVGRPAVHLVARVGHDALWVSVAVVAVVVVVAALRRRRAGQQAT